jgi:outer membrane protein assembly factor BamB
MMRLRAVGLALAMAMVVSVGGAGAATVSQTTSYQGDAGHSGGVTDPALDGPLQVLWTRPLVKGLSYPLVADGRAFVLSPGPNGSSIEDLVALDAATGQELWRRALQSASDLTYGDGMVYALNQFGLVVALDPATGVTRWANGPAALGVDAVYGPPAFHNGTLYYNGLTNDEGSSVVAMDGLTGAVLWHAPLSTYDADAGVAADDQGVYLGNECGYGLSWTPTGTLRWSTSTPCSGWGSGFGEQTVLADGRVFTDFHSGAVLDATTGAIVDEFVRPLRASLPAFGAGHVAVLSEGTLTIADRATLTTRGSYGTNNPDTGELLAQPFFVNDRVFSVDNRFHLLGIDAATATPSADVDLNSQLPSSWDPGVAGSGGIAAGGGVLVVATTDGRLVAVTGAGGPAPEPPVDVPAPPSTSTPPSTTVPPTQDPPVTVTPSVIPPPATAGGTSAPPVRATAAAVRSAARRVTFPAGARLLLVRRGLALRITGAPAGATVDAVLRAGGRVVWHTHAKVPKTGRVRLARPARAIAARSAQLELRVRAPHAKTLVVRRTLR